LLYVEGAFANELAEEDLNDKAWHLPIDEMMPLLHAKLTYPSSAGY
jgi:hypothetical protein